MELVFATSNKNKAYEVRGILGFDIGIRSVDIPEIQSLSAEENARHKAYEAYRIIRRPVIVEDTGLYIKGFGGFPGALVKWYLHGVGYDGICHAVDRCATRSAYAETCIGFYDGKIIKTFMGRVRGSIAKTPRGSNNFGWDSVFVPGGSKKTFAQMTQEEKSKVSHRGIATRKLRAFLGRLKTA